jgi:hypothetical protein
VTETLSPVRAVALAGWDQRFALVLALHEHDGVAIAVVDTNGDGREIEASVFELTSDGGWQEVASGIGSGSTPQVVWETGYSPSRRHVSVRYNGQTHEVSVVPETGSWYFAARRSCRRRVKTDPVASSEF